MNHHLFNIAGAELAALGSGALWWAARHVLTVSDLHLGKSERLARRGGPLLPPFENRETLGKLAADIARTTPQTVICLGDSFDDSEASRRLDEETRNKILHLQEGRDWIWIEGNHDPARPAIAGHHQTTITLGPLTFRHIAEPVPSHDVTGHFHPKITIRSGRQSQSRPCFLYDKTRVILPAYGAYTGGLKCTDSVFQARLKPPAFAVLTGSPPRVVPLNH